jgi:hypothetical protein
MKDFDRFDLEEQIFQCWNVVSDLKVISESILEGRSACNPDSVYNIVSGVATLYELKFDQLFRVFESLVTEFDEGKKLREGKNPELNKEKDKWLNDTELRTKHSEHYFQPDRNRPVKTPYPPLNKLNDPERPLSGNPSY